MNPFDETVSLEIFFQELAQDEDIQNELKSTLGHEVANVIISQLIKGIPSKEIKIDFEDIISEFIHNNSKEIETILGEGSHGEFSISIFNYGSVFWIEAQEFDSITYFRSKDDAVDYAAWEYMAYLGNDEDDEDDSENEENN